MDALFAKLAATLPKEVGPARHVKPESTAIRPDPPPAKSAQKVQHRIRRVRHLAQLALPGRLPRGRDRRHVHLADLANTQAQPV